MSSLGLLSFGSGFFNKLGQYDDEHRKEEADARKMKLAQQLQMELQEKKMELAQKYPRYTQFMKTPSGDIVGLGEYGQKGLMYQATPEEKDYYRRQREADIGAKESATKYQKAHADYLENAATELANARAERAKRGPQTKGITPAAFESAVTAETNRQMIAAGIDPRNLQRSDEEAIAKIPQIQAKARQDVAARYGQPSGLIAPQQQEEADDPMTALQGLFQSANDEQ